jgi:probable F420-dependent oxidoreductase
MRIGVVFPQTEFGNDPIAVRDYAQTTEELGFTHILAYDHVLGVNPNRPEGWTGPYNHKHSFLEPFVLFSYMAAVTQRVEFATGILILPQRQTALVAKQAATLDVLSNGRLRLGVGIGWNSVEFTTLNQDFHNRGKRIEEQVDLLRLLWSQPLIEFSGRWHTIPDAGINPLPVQRSIPIWFGGRAEAALRRAAKMGEGWMAFSLNQEQAKTTIDTIQDYLGIFGRNKSDFGIEAIISYGNGDPTVLLSSVQDWQSLGATHISINTMGRGFQKPSEHITALTTFAHQADLI